MIKRSEIDLPEDVYTQRWKAFLADQGKNPGGDFYSRWSWVVAMEQKFREQILLSRLDKSKS